MKVLVLGGTRFVGPLVVWRLLAARHDVTILNRGLTPDPFGDRVARLRGNRAQPGWSSALAGAGNFDAVVDFTGYVEADVREAANALRGRVGHYVFVSSGQVYLVREKHASPSRERDFDGPTIAKPADPADHWDWDYGMGKRACESFLAASGLPATRLRLPMVAGEGDPKQRVQGYLRRMLDGGPLLVPDGGEAPVRHVYAGAVARAIVAVLGAKDAIGGAFNLAQDETPTLVELIARIGATVGAKPRLVPVAREKLAGAGLVAKEVSAFSDRWMSFVDPTLAKTKLGFWHESLQEYLARIAAAYLAAPPAPPEAYAKRPQEIALAAAVA